MAYENIQFIAYCVHVGTKQQDQQLKFFYPGTGDDSDIKKRCTLMTEAIDLAYESFNVRDSEKTLKIFVAPEFFFRGAKGAYTLEKYHEILKKLREHVNKAWASHWLFVFGTVVAFSEVDQGKKEAYNIALVQKGNEAEDGCRIIMKEHKSDKDFVKRAALASDSGIGDDDVSYMPAKKSSGTGKERQKRDYGGESIFEMDDLVFGLEVCKDHDEKRLRKSPVGWKKAWVQVQIVPSAGMKIKKDAVVAVTDGLVFNCDGISASGCYAPKNIEGHSSLYKVTKACSKQNSAELKKVKELGYKPVTPPSLSQGIFFKGPGQLHFYPPCKVPKGKVRKSLRKEYKV